MSLDTALIAVDVRLTVSVQSFVEHLGTDATLGFSWNY